jgi:hypothetical protein
MRKGLVTMQIRSSSVVAMSFAAAMLGCSSSPGTLTQTEQAPTFELDRSWPKPLPNGWEFGYVMGVAVDQRDHVFVIHTIQDDYGQPIQDKERPNDSLKVSGWYERRKKPGAVAAPPLVEFDPEGNVVRAWGGPGHGHPWTEPGPEKMFAEHSVNVDPKGNVWIVGGGHVALKFSPEGKFLLQIGQLNKTNGSNDPRYLGDPASVAFDAMANEVYIADGYKNKRIIVFDMDTGVFKRLWGRYGKTPDDSFEASEDGAPGRGSSSGSSFGRARFVHDVKVSNDGIVYGVDRHDSIQLFRRDGTFLKEVQTPGRFTVVAFSPDPQQYYVYGGALDVNPRVFILRRSDMKVLGSFDGTSQHYLAVDSRGDIYTTGLSMPRKFVPKTMPKR